MSASALLIDGVPLPLAPNAPASAVYGHVLGLPSVIDGARYLAEQGATPTRIAPPQPGVYVFQREWAVVPTTQPVILGSDSATTCHILLAVSPKAVFCTHLDGVPSQVPAFLKALRESFPTSEDDLAIVDLYIAGGLDDVASRQLGAALLSALHRAAGTWPAARFNLKACCIGPLNTLRPKKAALPAVRALAWDAPAGRVIVNAWFDDKSPERWLRAAYSMAGTLPLVRTYDAATGKHDFGADYKLEPMPAAYIDELLGMDDATLLLNASTSPEAEHDTFCDEMRQTLWFLRSYQPA